MWTPRRVVLLLGGVLLFGGSYGAYTRVLGWLDGLPQLPEKFLVASDGTMRPPERNSSPTVELLKLAFGPDCPEQEDTFYPTKLEFRNGESSVVLAAGSTPLVPNSNRVTLSPFSLATFGKPRPQHLRQPGEVPEISTFHADKAVLEFDRAINNPNDMNKAKLLRLELVSEPELALPDPRRGKIHITNNQRSADPGKQMVIRTPGPLFYRDPKNNPHGSTGPDIWTDAEVEIVDRQNLPRGYGAAAPPTALTRGADLREPTAVPAILGGQRLPPPTVTALGMKIYLEPPSREPVSAPTPKKGSAGFSGVRRVELRERVLINLWVDARQGFISGPAATEAKEKPDPKPRTNPLAIAEPPAAIGGVVGGAFHATQTARQLDRALLQIETLGPFAYDVDKNLARFDVLPQADPKLPNDVQVTRIAPRGGQQRLFTQVLEIEFAGPPTAGKPAPAGKPNEPSGSSFKALHAWTYTPGRFLVVASEEERLEAYGQDLLYDQPAGRTTLSGSPLVVVRSNPPTEKAEKGKKVGGNVLTAGTPQRAAQLIMEPGPGPDKKAVARVEGPGKFDLFDPASEANTLQVSWLTRMTHVKETVGGREQDHFTFTDAARFEDAQAGYWLQGKELQLWVEAGKKSDDPNAPAAKPLPQRLQALGNVSSHSADFDIEQAEFLTVMFRDGNPPQPKQKDTGPPTPMNPVAVAAPMGPLPPPMNPAPEPPKEKEKPKPPLKLRARVVDTWVVRYPVPKPRPKADATTEPKAEAKPDTEAAVKYELEKARCEGKVFVHQDPDSPEKPRGLDIIGHALLLKQSPDGSEMTVTGDDKEPGQVHHEGMSIVGPTIVLDQLHNVCTVEGRGALSMPAGSDLSGTELKQPETMVVHWRDGMTFSGSTKTARFEGKVAAVQGESWVSCHTLQVHLDRPIYFNQLGKQQAAAQKPAGLPPTAAQPKDPADPKAREKDGPKVEKVSCYPAPGDAPDEPAAASVVKFTQVERDDTGKVVKTQYLEAKEIAVFAQAQDAAGGEKHQKVEASGPGGVVRIWQPGQREMTGPGAAPPMPMTGANPMSPVNPPVMEMKLTVVNFNGRMTTKDKGKVYQEATFYGDVEVIHAPTDDPAAEIARHKLPPRSMVLTCAKQLVVSTHKRKDAPPAQRMDATGNAFIRSDEYDGWGELITYDGQFVVLEGSGPTLARITGRFQKSENSGQRIVYDRMKNAYQVDRSDGGTFQQPKK